MILANPAFEMDAQFWHARWQEKSIGFHRPEVNAYLKNFWPLLNVPAGGGVFVPLCGKSLDMLWLADQGFQVTGVEISDIAVREFFAENALQAQSQSWHGGELWHSDNIKIFCGDYFGLQAADLHNIAAVYDRAALISLPPTMRQQYIHHLLAITPPQAPILLITLEFDNQIKPGPPFSVTEQEVRVYFGSRYHIGNVKTFDVLQQSPRFLESGIRSLHEKVYCLQASG